MDRHNEWADISKSQDLFSGNVDPNKAVLRFSFEAFLRCFNFSTTHKWGDISTPRLELPSPTDSFSVYPLHFTSLHFTSLDLLQEGRGDSRQIHTSFLAITNNRTNRSASGIQVARSLGEAGGCSAMQCNAINTLHPYRIASHYARTIHTALKGPGRPPSVVITVRGVTSATAATNDSLGSWLR